MPVTTTQEKQDKALGYNEKMLKAVEYFLSQTPKEANIFVNLIKDLQSKKGVTGIPLSFGTIWLIVKSCVFAPREVSQLFSFALDITKYNTPEFQQALITSDKTSAFIKSTVSDFDFIADTLKDHDLLNDGGMELMKNGLSNEVVIKSLLDIAKGGLKIQMRHRKIYDIKINNLL